MNRPIRETAENAIDRNPESTQRADALGMVTQAQAEDPTPEQLLLLPQLQLPLPLGTFILDGRGYVLQHIPPFESSRVPPTPEPTTLIGRSAVTLLSELSPLADADTTGRWMQLQQALTGRAENAEWVYGVASQIPVRQFRLRVQRTIGHGPLSGWLTHEEITPQLDLAAELNRAGNRETNRDIVLSELIRQLPIGVVVAEAPSGRFILANEHVSELLGRPVIPMRAVDEYQAATNFHSDGRPYLAEDYPLAQAVRHGRVVTNQEIIVHRPDGGRRHVRTSATPLCDTAGNVIAAISTFTDVTDQVEALDELRQAQERYARVAENGRVGVWEIDLKADPMYLSPNLKRMLGYTDAEIPNLHSAWCQTLHPDDKALAQRGAEEYFNGERSEYCVEVRRRHKDGHYLWFLVQGTAIPDEAGEPKALVGSDTDITARKHAEAALRESEERLRLGLDAGRTGLWDWDIARGTLEWSPRIYEIHGLEPENFSGRIEDFARWIHPEDREWVQERIQAALQSGEPYEAEFRILRPDGTVRWIATAAHPKLNIHGEAIRLVGATSDVTERREQEASRETLLESERAARSEMQRALRLKEEFLATLSHELRTPMNSILGWSTLLQSYGIDPDLRAEGIAAIDRNARIQTQIIEDLLDMSRITAGKLQLRIQALDMSSAVEAAIDTLQPAATARNISIHFQRPSANIELWGDPNRLQQIIWNLLSNAVKFAPPGGEIQLELQQFHRSDATQNEWDEVQLSVRDFGEGIDSAFLPHVFDRFRQADSSTTRRHGGLGLGLSIVKQLVELHGGHIEVHSAGRGHGATFTVTLPARHMPTLRSGFIGVETVDESSKGEVRPLTGKKILLVDDEVDVRDMVRQVLEMDGAEVVACFSAASAWELLHTQPFDILVSDISMPQEDGYSFIRRIRQSEQHFSNIPALALTAFGRGEDKERALAAGFNLHQTKPVEPATLVQTLLKLF